MEVKPVQPEAEPVQPVAEPVQHDEEPLQLGDTLNRFLVDKVVSEGAFGAVYVVSDSADQYTLKTEDKTKIQVLKVDAWVLQAVAKINNRHCAQIADIGYFGVFNFIVMTLVGQSLQDLLKARPDHMFSWGTAIGVGIQALEALEDLHKVGYMHRDVKPGSFAIGRPERNEIRKLYLVDFAKCKKWRGVTGGCIVPRFTQDGFIGTVRYASYSAHIEREQCRRDDLESWLYMVVEYTVGRLPWKDGDDMEQMGEYKKKCRQEPDVSHLLGYGTDTYCPFEMWAIAGFIANYNYFDEPEYEKMYAFLRQVFLSTSARQYPYDWEG